MSTFWLDCLWYMYTAYSIPYYHCHKQTTRCHVRYVVGRSQSTHTDWHWCMGKMWPHSGLCSCSALKFWYKMTLCCFRFNCIPKIQYHCVAGIQYVHRLPQWVCQQTVKHSKFVLPRRTVSTALQCRESGCEVCLKRPWPSNPSKYCQTACAVFLGMKPQPLYVMRAQLAPWPFLAFPIVWGPTEQCFAASNSICLVVHPSFFKGMPLRLTYGKVFIRLERFDPIKPRRWKPQIFLIKFWASLLHLQTTLYWHVLYLITYNVSLDPVSFIIIDLNRKCYCFQCSAHSTSYMG